MTSGLTYIVERFKDFDGSANIFLNGVVRSRLACSPRKISDLTGSLHEREADGFPFLIPPISCLFRSAQVAQRGVIAAVQGYPACPGHGPASMKIGDERAERRERPACQPSLWRQSAAQVAQQPGVIAATRISGLPCKRCVPRR